MDEKLYNLYNECILELKSVGIDITDENIDIKIALRNTKRYGCCKCENPIKSSLIKEKRGRKIIGKYQKFENYHIEISKWVMLLDEKIIKNTIMHEIIHCLPSCNNHGKQFKDYANYINKKLGYNITRLGNKLDDYKTSNLSIQMLHKQYKYKITCKNCGAISYRQRIAKNFTLKYRCAICSGKLIVENFKDNT